MAAMLSLNQVTWVMWPLLLAAVAAWRTGRWNLGAVPYGLALSIKPFLGVVLLWLIASRRWGASATALVVAAAAFALGVLAYGVQPLRLWVAALRSVQWTAAPMNASLEGWAARGGGVPALVVLAAAGLVLLVAIAAARNRPVDDAWPLLLAVAVLVSPLGWIYYLWWIFPGRRPYRVLLSAPLLWVPWAYIPANPSSPLVSLTIGSVYFWGVVMLCVAEWARARPSIAG
jgi:alpha-1,2-mannosyltransferase